MTSNVTELRPTTTDLPDISFAEDVRPILDIRSSIQEALKLEGAMILSSGFGRGFTDTEILFEDCKYNVTIQRLDE